VILPDSYALTALLANEPAATEVGELISAGRTVVAAPNLAETADRLGRVHGIAVQRTRAVVESLEQSTDLRMRAAEHTQRMASSHGVRIDTRPISLI
jgi:uncharacterized protein with PIN domain